MELHLPEGDTEMHKQITDVRPNEPPMAKQLEATMHFRKEAEQLGITGTAATLYAREKVREWMNGQCEIPTEMRSLKFTESYRRERGDAYEPPM